MSTLWTFGCSFTANYDPIEGLHIPYKNVFDDYKEYRGGNFPDIWPKILSDKLGFELMNCAKGGSSNYKILNQFLDVCDIIEKDDIVIFGWTSILRYRVVNHEEDIFVEVLPNSTKFIQTNVSIESLDQMIINRSHRLWVNEVRNWIRFINVYLGNIGAKVYHWTSDNTVFDQFDKFIDEKRFITVDENDNESNKTDILSYLNLPCFHDGVLKSRIVEETGGVINDDHMGEFGHKVMGEYFHKHITKHLNNE
jgi:hypothetical protein